MADTHMTFILASYGVSVLALAGLALWIALDGWLVRRRLAELEARGVRRRSAGRSLSS